MSVPQVGRNKKKYELRLCSKGLIAFSSDR